MIITTTHQHPLETAHATLASYADISVKIDNDGKLHLQPN
jgi:sugar-phosphatase